MGWIQYLKLNNSLQKGLGVTSGGHIGKFKQRNFQRHRLKMNELTKIAIRNTSQVWIVISGTSTFKIFEN